MRFTSALLLAFGSFALHASTVLGQIPSGRYLIFNQNGNATVGRSPDEDHSLHRKKIVVTSEPSEWDIEALPNGRFTLSIGGNPATPINKLVCAELQSHRREEWVIENHFQSGGFTIETPHKQCGWILNDNELDAQVDCRPLVVGKGEPPSYPDIELWQFYRQF